MDKELKEAILLMIEERFEDRFLGDVPSLMQYDGTEDFESAIDIAVDYIVTAYLLSEVVY